MKQNFATIAFYNVENFYSKSSDESFLPSNFIKWKDNRYETKLNKIAFCISKIGRVETNELPFLVGLAEVENDDVLQDLTHNDFLKEGNYKTLLYESLDERKINVGLIYRQQFFEVLESEPIRFVFKDQFDNKSYTRDILYVKGKLMKETVHLFIVHLPSKIDKEINQLKRQHIFKTIRKRINDLLIENHLEKIIVMGDFNDSPTNPDLIDELNTRAKQDEVNRSELFNPMVGLQSYKRGSMVFKKQWMLFDQQLFSKGFLTSQSNLEYIKTAIFDANFLKNSGGKSSGLPFRTFVGGKYFGGYSDHFPVYTILKY
ncbi:endonuclease [Empedobacter stercoris]|uniref:endonuclease/exonuclease/phosphatase family protein n=1 Tax=Empedobacter stercoris TaxID=1628248 RepID=UPI001CE1DB41|nr:endonuclease [Empedobacter stercoris]MCA4782457.1 endonuclease [Empedobacter stercoris]